ncbi:Uncharacterized protein GBIM_09412 [Gryllus bimaculatus]|nr:Uncharacterized protein GBIM_09412 [Gryllus bimaculatus]
MRPPDVQQSVLHVRSEAGLHMRIEKIRRKSRKYCFIRISAALPVVFPGLEGKAVEAGAPGAGAGAGPEAATERRRIVRNVAVLSAAFMVHFTAFQGAGNLQSSVNAEKGLGTAALATIYASLILSNVFLPVLVIRYLRHPNWELLQMKIAFDNKRRLPIIRFGEPDILQLSLSNEEL